MKFLKNCTALVNTGKTVLLCWVPGHVSIKGNEQVDEVAKMALHSSISAIEYPPSDFYHDVTAVINSSKLTGINVRAINSNLLSLILDTIL